VPVAVKRYVAIGDSQTEGLHDYYDDGTLRGWADRFAELLVADGGELSYANLAVRGRRTAAIRREQLAPALALEPDLATVVSGVNDVVQPRFELAPVVDDLSAMYEALHRGGCRVMGCTFPLPAVGIAKRLAPRLIALNAAIRRRAEEIGITLVDLEEIPMASDLRLSSPDRIHLNPAGHPRLAAAFHAPLAGFIFTIEELQREFSSLTYSMALVAAVVADIVAISYLGSAEAFHPAGFPALTLTALPACVVIGALAGALGTAFNKSLLAMQAFVRGQITLAPWQRAAAIGLVVGVVIWYVPDLAGGGHHTAERLLDAADAGATEVPYLLLLLVGKFALTLLCYCAGVPGGIFAPMLLIGACLGILTGIGTQALAPAAVAIPESLAAIGMAAFFSAVVRAPLTGIVLVLQMTGDWNQLLPLLTAAMIAYVVSEKLKTEPIYEALLHADTGGRKVDIPSQREPVLIEFIVQQESAMDGKAIRALPLPKRCLFVTITRQGEDLLPNGDTVLHSGDHVTAVLSGPDPSASVVRVLALSKA